ncbi:MAG: hypothetical protein GY705_17835, partial [Bacteroidetes bacterium]|nr:hypothetical protein [Bacteroidota bacterium]
MAYVIPVDVRKKVVDAYEQSDNSIDKIAQIHSVSPASLKNWIKQKRNTGSLEPQIPKRLGRKPVLDQDDRDFIKNILSKNPSISTGDIKSLLAEERKKNVSLETIRKTLIDMGYAYKNKRKAQQSEISNNDKKERKINNIEIDEAQKKTEAEQETTENNKEHRYQPQHRFEPPKPLDRTHY